jgi:hypothetical protein
MLKSPKDDFARSLDALPNTIDKLNYVSGLRQPNGDYFHWGMSRSHGDETANVTIAQAHSDLFGLTLKTPLRWLWEEVDTAALRTQNNEENEWGGLPGPAEKLIPADLKGGSERHFRSVLLALSLLAASQEQKARRGA